MCALTNTGTIISWGHYYLGGSMTNSGVPTSEQSTTLVFTQVFPGHRGFTALTNNTAQDYMLGVIYEWELKWKYWF